MWPSHQRYRDGNSQSEMHHQISHDFEFELTHHESSGSIFMTDSSKPLEINDMNMSQVRTGTSLNGG